MRFTQVCGRPVSCQNFEFWLFKCDWAEVVWVVGESCCGAKDSI